MKKEYEVDYDFKASIIVEIDHDVLTEEKLHEMNNFFSDAKSRLKNEGGNVLNAVLKILATKILCLEIEYNFNTYGIKKLFDRDGSNGGQEGWPKLDGSEGIELISVEGLEFDESDMVVTIK